MSEITEIIAIMGAIAMIVFLVVLIIFLTLMGIWVALLLLRDIKNAAKDIKDGGDKNV